MTPPGFTLPSVGQERPRGAGTPTSLGRTSWASVRTRASSCKSPPCQRAARTQRTGRRLCPGEELGDRVGMGGPAPMSFAGLSPLPPHSLRAQGSQVGSPQYPGGLRPGRGPLALALTCSELRLPGRDRRMRRTCSSQARTPRKPQGSPGGTEPWRHVVNTRLSSVSGLHHRCEEKHRSQVPPGPCPRVQACPPRVNSPHPRL